MMDERMIRIDNCRECQECRYAFEGTGEGIASGCPLEPAPPRNWKEQLDDAQQKFRSLEKFVMDKVLTPAMEECLSEFKK